MDGGMPIPEINLNSEFITPVRRARPARLLWGVVEALLVPWHAVLC